MTDLFDRIREYLQVDDTAERVDRLNQLRAVISTESPFRHEPVDFVACQLPSSALSTDASTSTYGRTDRRRTTHLSSYLTLGIARRGAERNV